MENYVDMKAVKIAAKWWADTLRGDDKQNKESIVRRILSNDSNDNENLAYYFYNFAKFDVVSEDKISEFEELLQQKIVKEIKEKNVAYLYTEVGAEGLLSIVANECGIGRDCFSKFPAYCEMFVENGKEDYRYDEGPFLNLYDGRIK